MFGSDGVIGTFLLVLFSPDGKTVIAVDSQDNIDVFDANTGRLKDTLAVAAGGGTSLAMSPDGALLAVGTVNGMVRLYDTSDYQPAGAALVTQSTVRSVAFNRTGRQLAAGLQNGAVQLWDIAYTTDTAATVCAKAGRSLSKEEWNTEIPAGPAYQHICP
jgi:WD40 repeat protein